jgi:hypothetical protein
MLARLMTVIRALERAFIALVMIAMSALFFANVAVRELAPARASRRRRCSHWHGSSSWASASRSSGGATSP